MQRGYAALVQGVGIRTCFDEIDDHLMLRISVPVARTGTRVCGVVERFGTPSIPGTNIRTVRHQRPGEVSSVGCRGNVQRSIPCIDVVMYCTEEVRTGILAGRSDADGTG